MKRCSAYGQSLNLHQLLLLAGDGPAEVREPEQERPASPPPADYLNLHLTGGTLLGRACRNGFISASTTLNKVFKRATSTTVMDYIIHKRVARPGS